MWLTKVAVLATCVLFSTAGFGQGENNKQLPRYPYFNQFTCGGLIGKKELGISFSASTVHGIAIDKFRVGAGVGIDQYDSWRVIPVFASVSIDLIGIKDNKLFAQLAGGWTDVTHRYSADDNVNFHDDGGAMIQPSIGYRIKSAEWKIYVIGGYRLQRIRYSQTPRWGWDLSYSRSEVVHDMNRLYVQIGFGLN